MGRCSTCGKNAGFLLWICSPCAAEMDQASKPRTNQLPRPEPPILSAGMRVRVKGKGSSVATGTLLRIDASSIVIDAGDAQLAIQRSDIGEISHRRAGSRARAFTLLFAVFGAGALGSCGFLLDALTTMGNNGKITPGFTFLGVIVGATVVGLLGFLIDQLRPSTHWQRARLPNDP